MAQGRNISIKDQIACVERELALRENVYPRRIAEGKMKPAQAENEIARMRAVLATLKTRQLDA